MGQIQFPIGRLDKASLGWQAGRLASAEDGEVNSEDETFSPFPLASSAHNMT